ncbi:iron ABC transporter permease [Lysobacter sp. ISL-50]|uniref:FecCD family ABC transporter permease n=1 Tax=unclassified Lysobacter TaxID=2635362 RepID=UPI001BE83793|nr:iron ABC transporter permease [Lysobacter sp. ISL-42]MBT2751550.1 iron ABC transporter permease [Lysobacter sp. ISL-50]MBT2775744.1 iron ABC transporter permease [Lysobacter sp. ISL-54]MBT2782291.1 iron ABC transporter permease [Lysobacter sp. ISL-52]
MSAAPLAMPSPAQRRSPMPYFAVATLLIVLGLALIASLAVGQVVLSPLQVVRGLAEFGSASNESRIVVELRLPRVLAALVGGSALGLAGLLMQTLFRNPLADTWSLGLMAGGQFGAALVVVAGAVVGPAALEMIAGLAGVGIVAGSVLGMSGVALSMVSMARRVSTVTLLVLGLMLGFLAQGLISVLLHFTNRTQSRVFSSWNDATFASIVWPDFATLLPPLLVGLGLAVWLAKPLTALLLGETYAESLGVNVPRLRRLVLAATILLAAPVTALCGPVAFIGLITPHLARGLIGSARIGALIPATLLLGALLALVADLVVHLPWNQHFLHLNAILAILGAPVVILLLLNSRSLRAQEA